VKNKSGKKIMAKKSKPAIKKKATAMKTTKSSTSSSMSDSLPKVRQASKPRNTGTWTYTQSEVIENLRAFTGLPKRSKAKELSSDIAAFLVDSLKRGYKIPLFGICKLQVRTSKARTGRNPQTGATIQIPARKRVRFTATKALKEAVL
jgi:nucleoid DNA-binding protein